MIPLTSFFALLIVLLGAICISSGYIIVKALNKFKSFWKDKFRKGESA